MSDFSAHAIGLCSHSLLDSYRSLVSAALSFVGENERRPGGAVRVPLRPHSHGGEEEDAVSLDEVQKGNVPPIPACVITKWLSCVCVGGGGN